MYLILIWLVCSFVVAMLADGRGRGKLNWFALSVLISPVIAAFILYVKPDLRDESGNSKPLKDRLFWPGFWLVIVLLASFKWFYPESQDKEPETVAQTAQPATKPERLASQTKNPHDAAFIMTEKGFPKMYAKWGKAEVERINALMLEAAELAAMSPSCRGLYNVAFSGQRSSKDNIVFFADCDGGERLYIDERQIEKRVTSVGEEQKAGAVSDSEYVSMCRTQVKGRLKLPSSFDSGVFDSAVNRAMAGRVVVTLDFEAKNSIGEELSKTGKCFYSGGNLMEVEIK